MERKIKTILFLLTYKCNLRCQYCFYNINDTQHNGIKDLQNHRSELTLEEIDQLVLQPAKEKKVKQIIFTGGEPMIRKDIQQLLKKTIDYNIKCVLQSNLTLDIDYLLKDEKIMNNVYFRISLDGVEEKNDLTRGIGSYKKTITNIFKILKYYKYNGIENKISINTVVTQNNIDNLDVHIQQLINMGIDNISLQLVTRNISDTQINLSKKDIDKMLTVLKEIKSIININNIKIEIFPVDIDNISYESLYKWYNDNEFFEWHGCSTIYKRLTISPYGDVFTCIEKPYASLREKSFEEIIQDEQISFIEKVNMNGPLQECFRCCNLEVYKDNLDR